MTSLLMMTDLSIGSNWVALSVHGGAKYPEWGTQVCQVSCYGDANNLHELGGGGVAKNGSVKFPMTPEVNTFLRNYISIGQKLTMLFKQTPNVTIDLVQQ